MNTLGLFMCLFLIKCQSNKLNPEKDPNPIQLPNLPDNSNEESNSPNEESNSSNEESNSSNKKNNNSTKESNSSNTESNSSNEDSNSSNEESNSSNEESNNSDDESNSPTSNLPSSPKKDFINYFKKKNIIKNVKLSQFYDSIKKLFPTVFENFDNIKSIKDLDNKILNLVNSNKQEDFSIDILDTATLEALADALPATSKLIAMGNITKFDEKTKKIIVIGQEPVGLLNYHINKIKYIKRYKNSITTTLSKKILTENKINTTLDSILKVMQINNIPPGYLENNITEFINENSSKITIQETQDLIENKIDTPVKFEELIKFLLKKNITSYEHFAKIEEVVSNFPNELAQVKKDFKEIKKIKEITEKLCDSEVL